MAAISPSVLLPVAIAVLFVWRMYARLRRIIGRQQFSRRRALVTLTFYPLLLVIFLLVSMKSPASLLAMLVGAGAGAVVGFYGLRLTTFEVTPLGQFYTPNLHLSIAVFVVFIGRIAYRWLQIYLATAPPLAPASSFVSDPFTAALFSLLASYYVSYAIGLLQWSKRAGPAVEDVQPGI